MLFLWPLQNKPSLKIDRINTFQPKHKFQKTAIAFLVHQMSCNKMIESLKKIFKEMDTHGNGRLSYEDLIEGLRKYSDLHFSDGELEKIMDSLDDKGSGYIEYEEFLRATIDMDTLLTEKNLRMAFNFFDTDGTGKLSIKDIKNTLGVMNDNKEKETTLLKTILEDITTEDDKISFETFKNIMKAACSNTICSTVMSGAINTSN